ncbi:MAG: magnesium transporter CorA, partial [Plesiomonas shigelloides]
MLSAFKLDDCRLQRLELDEQDKLTSALWVDLIEPDEEERDRVQH